jgi:DNA-directed RNA polymerase specialized sigma24 family protein
MPPPSHARIPAIEQLNIEWRTVGRSLAARRALQDLASRNPAVARLTEGENEADGSGAGSRPPACETLFDLVTFMRRASGRRGREEAAALVQILLRDGRADPLLARCLVQALLPGLLTVARRLRWGQGGEWENGSEFFSELLSTTWLVIDEWTGQDRPYAVLDLLSAIRCRLRRQLFRARALRQQQVQLSTSAATQRVSQDETDLELVARRLLELRSEGMADDEVEVLYAHHVLGFSISELATLTGRDRRALYARRSRGQRRLCA